MLKKILTVTLILSITTIIVCFLIFIWHGYSHLVGRITFTSILVLLVSATLREAVEGY